MIQQIEAYKFLNFPITFLHSTSTACSAAAVEATIHLTWLPTSCRSSFCYGYLGAGQIGHPHAPLMADGTIGSMELVAC